MKKSQTMTATSKQPARATASNAGRLKTKLTFETNNQAYLWITDRGRSRLIKH